MRFLPVFAVAVANVLRGATNALRHRLCDTLISDPHDRIVLLRLLPGITQLANQQRTGGTQSMNVFVLGTGRCGTMTFTRACERFDNYTAGHETQVGSLGCDRLNYPPSHIESDNRLSWFLGELGARYDDQPVLYVHLRRERSAVLDSFVRRWDSSFRASIIRAFAHGVVVRTLDYSPDEVKQVCELYIDTVTANIRDFLTHRPSVEMHVETLTDTFGAFVDRIDAEGDIEGAFAELDIHHNAE